MLKHGWKNCNELCPMLEFGSLDLLYHGAKRPWKQWITPRLVRKSAAAWASLPWGHTRTVAEMKACWCHGVGITQPCKPLVWTPLQSRLWSCSYNYKTSPPSCYDLVIFSNFLLWKISNIHKIWRNSIMNNYYNILPFALSVCLSPTFSPGAFLLLPPFVL